MIRLADMDDDQYEYQEEKYRVIGHYSGKEYSMGQTVKIRVIGADRLTRTIDFAIADNSPKDSEYRRKKHGKRNTQINCK